MPGKRWQAVLVAREAPVAPGTRNSPGAAERRTEGLLLTLLHGPLVGVEECSQAGTVVHHKGTALGSLCGNAAVLQVQGDLRAGRSCSPDVLVFACLCSAQTPILPDCGVQYSASQT